MFPPIFFPPAYLRGRDAQPPFQGPTAPLNSQEACPLNRVPTGISNLPISLAPFLLHTDIHLLDQTSPEADRILTFHLSPITDKLLKPISVCAGSPFHYDILAS